MIRVVVCLGFLALAAAACSSPDSSGHDRAREGTPIILLFNGTGTSPNDVAALGRVLDDNHFTYAMVSSRQLETMSAAELGRSRLLIMPGGNFVEMGNHLTPAAVANVREAVHGGLSYLGICGGAFLAGNSPYNGLNLTSGVRFGFYAAEDRGVRKAAVPIAIAGSTTFDHYWEDGPQLTGWGHIVGKYPDGTPAIVEGAFGDGRVILSGVHPEAPESWRRGMTFSTPASVDAAYAATLIGAAVSRTPLMHY